MKQKSRYSEIKKNRKFFIGRPKLCLKEVLETKEKLKKKETWNIIKGRKNNRRKNVWVNVRNFPSLDFSKLCLMIEIKI